jgi:DNA-binding NarL/FixJ family response regulator
MRVLVVDDHGLTRAALRWAVHHDDEFELVGEASSTAQAVAAIKQCSPELVLLAADLTATDVLTCLERIKRAHQQVKVIVLAEHSSQITEAACQRGASGVILKSSTAGNLSAAIHQVLGALAFSPLGKSATGEQPAEAAGASQTTTSSTWFSTLALKQLNAW